MSALALVYLQWRVCQSNDYYLISLKKDLRKITAVKKDSSNPKLQCIMIEDKNN